MDAFEAYLQTQVKNQALTEELRSTLMQSAADRVNDVTKDKKLDSSERTKKINLVLDLYTFLIQKFSQGQMKEQELLILTDFSVSIFDMFLHRLSNGTSMDKLFYMFKNPLEYYLDMYDKHEFLDDAYVQQFLKTRGVTLDDDKLLDLFHENDKNLTLALYSWYSTEKNQELQEKVDDILGVLQGHDIHETRVNVMLRLFGDMNPDTVVQYFLKLKANMDRAVSLLPTCLEHNDKKYSIDRILSVIADADGDMDKIMDIMAGNKTFFESDKEGIIVNVKHLPLPEWRFSHASLEDKQSMDWLTCLGLNTYLQLLVQSLKDKYAKKLQEMDPSLLENIHQDVLNVELVDSLLAKLNQYAVECNKLCVLALVPQIFIKLRPLNMCIALFHDMPMELFYVKYIGYIFTEETYTIASKHDNFEDYIIYQVHPDNREGYHAIDPRLLLPTGGQLTYYNSMTPVITKQKLLATRGGTLKHKKETKKKTVRLR